MLCSLMRRCAATFVHFSLLAIAFATAPLASADTLVSWDLSIKNLNGGSSHASTYITNALADATLSRSSGSAPSDSNVGFGANIAVSKGTVDRLFEISFTVAPTHNLSLDALTYFFYKGSSGPSPIYWIVYTNDVHIFTSATTEVSSTDASTPTFGSLDLSTLGTVPAGTCVRLDLFATSQTKGRHLSFCSTLTLTGTAIAAGGGEGQGEDDGELSVSTAVGAISVYAGEPKTISFTATGLGDAAASTNLYLVANDIESAVGGFASVENGVITISPTKADVGEKTLRLKVSINDGEANEASAYADIAISVATRSPAVSADNASVTAYVGSPTTMNFSFTDDVGTLTTNVVCNRAEVSNESWTYTDGVLTYTPAAGDVALSPVSFTVSITGTDNCGDAVDESATVTVTVEEPLETLVTWNINSNSGTPPGYGVTYANPSPITVAALALGKNTQTTTTANTYQLKGFSKDDDTFEKALEAGAYIEVSFTTAANYSIRPKLLTYNIRRANTSVTNAQWIVVTDSGYAKIGDELAFDAATGMFNNLSLDLSSLGEVGKDTTTSLRLVAWNLTGNTSAAFGFNTSSIVLQGSATEDTEAYVEPSIAINAIENPDCYVGGTNIVTFNIFGDKGTVVTTNATCTTYGVTGKYTSVITNGVFKYEPSAADVALGEISFSATLHVEADGYVTKEPSASFSVRVWDKPAFFEDFENKTKTSWGDDSPDSVEGSVATWCGTNYMVQGTAQDARVGGVGHAVRFQKGAGYLEMTTAKNGGAGSVALSHGFYGTQTGTATITVKISQKSGKVWGDWEDIGTISVGEELTRTCFTRLEYEGFVKLRIEYVSTANFNIDDVAIGDYGDPVEDPQEDATILPIVNSSSLSQNFKGIGNTATATLPNGWRMVATNALDCHDLKWGDGQSTTTKRGGFGMSASASSGFYNFTNGNENAVGFLSSGSSFKSCALMVQLKNTGPDAIGLLDVSYNVEQWRRGYGKRIALYISRDGETWTQAGARFVTTTETNYAEGSETEVDSTGYAAGELPAAISVSGRIRLSSEEKLAAGESLWLAWHYTRLEGNTSDDGGKAQALAIDDVKIAAGDIKMTTFVVQ